MGSAMAQPLLPAAQALGDRQRRSRRERHQPVRRQQHDPDDQGTDADEPVFGPALQHFFRQQQHDRPDDGPGRRILAAIRTITKAVAEACHPSI